MTKVKPVIINGKQTQYFLFSNGDLYNEKSHKISTGAISNGYIRYNLQLEDEVISIAKHRLSRIIYTKQ